MSTLSIVPLCPRCQLSHCVHIAVFVSYFSVHVTVGTSEVTVESRGCMKVHKNTVLNKCKPIGSDSERKFAGEVLSVLSEVSGVEVDGKVCYCGTDLCDTNCNGVAIGTVWYVLHSNRATNSIFHGIHN